MNFLFVIFPKFGNLTILYDVKIGPKGTKFVYYIPNVIEISNSITMVFPRLAIHF